MAVELCMAQESVWFDQTKYEDAEARYQEIVADRHAGLHVEGKAIPQANSTKHLSSEIERAKHFIEDSLKKASARGSSGSSGLDQRVSRLETENKQLRSTLEQVQERLSALETTVAKLSGGNPPQPPVESKTEEDDDFELFQSDEDEDNDAEAERLKQERLKQYETKKAKKQPVIAKSSLILDVKPWDDETDVKEMERMVRSVEADGLRWGASKFVPVAYGIKKLQITCVIEDDKIGTDFLEEEITAFEDYVQSVDIVAFNKI